jgi:hypothetical protein
MWFGPNLTPLTNCFGPVFVCMIVQENPSLSGRITSLNVSEALICNRVSIFAEWHYRDAKRKRTTMTDCQSGMGTEDPSHAMHFIDSIEKLPHGQARRLFQWNPSSTRYPAFRKRS